MAGLSDQPQLAGKSRVDQEHFEDRRPNYHSADAPGPIRERLIEFLKLLMGSSAVGFSIAVLQHYVTFGVRG